MFSALSEQASRLLGEYLYRISDSIIADNHNSQKYFMSVIGQDKEKVTTDTAAPYANAESKVNDVNIIGFETYFTRDITSMSEANRQHNSIINPPMAAIVMQNCPGYIQIAEEYAKATRLKTVTIVKKHQLKKKIESIESHIFSEVQILCMRAYFVGNVSIVGMLVQSAELEVTMNKIEGKSNTKKGTFKAKIGKAGIAE